MFEITGVDACLLELQETMQKVVDVEQQSPVCAKNLRSGRRIFFISRTAAAHHLLRSRLIFSSAQIMRKKTA
jgi:hypothetical protein